jgi:hypothetical protein
MVGKDLRPPSPRAELHDAFRPAARLADDTGLIRAHRPGVDREYDRGC